MAKMNKALAQEVRDAMERWYKYWKVNNDKYQKRTAFVMGEQYTSDDLKNFNATGKKALKMNKLYPIVNNVIGEYIKITPNMQVVAKVQNSDELVDDIETMQDLFKTISFSSNSKQAYRTAVKNAARGGYGAYMIDTDYESPKSFNQCIKIIEIKDPTTCFWDKHAKESTKVDGEYCGRYIVMKRQTFEAKYPGLKLPSSDAYYIKSLNLNWCDDDSLVIVDYLKKVRSKTTLYKIPDLGIIEAGEYTGEELKKYFSADEIKELPILAQRETEIVKVKRYKVAGEHELEATEVLTGDEGDLTILFVDQESWYDGEQQYTRPLIEDAVDAQRYMNYLATQMAYLVKLQRAEQYKLTPKMIQGFEAYWKDPTKVQGALLYNPDPMQPNGPAEIMPPQISPTLMQQYERAMQDIHTSTGIFPTQIGNQGNEISGRAIQQRAEQGNISNIAFFVNANMSISRGGQIILKMTPNYYDTERTLVVQSNLGNSRTVTINQKQGDFGPVKNNIKGAQYLLTVDASMSFEAQKQQALESLQLILQANPQVFMAIADLYAENLPLANTAEITNRLRTMVPPQLIAAGKGQKVQQPQQQPQPDPAAIQMQMQQQEMQQKFAIEQAQLNLKANDQALEQEKLKLKEVELMNNMSIAQGKQKTELLNSAIQAGAHDMAHNHKMIDTALKHVRDLQKTTGGNYDRTNY
jgi:hypothetical protein